MANWEPTDEDVIRVLTDQNPWQSTGRVPATFAPPIERELARGLYQRVLDADLSRFQVVVGPRRVGKTTAMYQTVKRLLGQGVPRRSLWFFRLDHPLLLDSSLDQLVRAAIDLAGASESEPAHLFFDELVYAKDWDLWLKTFHDQNYPIRVIATSSATAALGRRRLESGLGRWDEHILMPYLFTEFLDLLKIEPHVHFGKSLARTIEYTFQDRLDLGDLEGQRQAYLLTGGFPELLLRLNKDIGPDDLETRLLESQRVLRGDAIERAVYKDIPQSYAIDDPMALERLLYSLAGQVTGIISPSRMCGELRISQPTLDRYISYLERAFLVFTLPNYSGREASVQKRGRRIYFVDTALRNAALQRGLAPLRRPEEMGLLLENLVASQLHVMTLNTNQRLFHWRDGRDEVDLVLDDPESPLAIEVSSSSDHSRHGLRALMERHPRFAGHSYLVSPDVPLMDPSRGGGVGTIPLDLFLVLVGRQAQAAIRLRLGGIDDSSAQGELDLRP